MYPVSVSYFPVPERGVFCILIVDIILRIALIVFSVLRERSYHYKKEPVIVDNITILTIHRGLLCIIFLESISLRWEIIYWTTMIFLFLSFFRSRYLLSFFSKISNLCFLCIFCHNFFEAVKEFHKFCFWILIYRTTLNLLFIGHKVRKKHANVYQQSTFNYTHHLFFPKRSICHHIVNKLEQG